MSRPEADELVARFGSLPKLPREDGAPVFAEPWQAQAFALAVRLSAEGHFTWNEWAQALGHQLQATSPADLAKRKQAWADAYRHTPHGRPVELGGKRSG